MDQLINKYPHYTGPDVGDNMIHILGYNWDEKDFSEFQPSYLNEDGD